MSHLKPNASFIHTYKYQSRVESLIYLYCRLSPVYLNTSKEMEMYLDDSSSERKIIWHILKVGISLKLLKPLSLLSPFPAPASSLLGLSWKKEGIEDAVRGMVWLRHARECEVILKRFLPTEVYINWRFTKASTNKLCSCHLLLSGALLNIIILIRCCTCDWKNILKKLHFYLIKKLYYI